MIVQNCAISFPFGTSTSMYYMVQNLKLARNQEVQCENWKACGLYGTDRSCCSFPCCRDQWTWVICLIVVMYYCMTLQLQILIPTWHAVKVVNTDTIKHVLLHGAVAVLLSALSGKLILINPLCHHTPLLLWKFLFELPNLEFLWILYCNEM